LITLIALLVDLFKLHTRNEISVCQQNEDKKERQRDLQNKQAIYYEIKYY